MKIFKLFLLVTLLFLIAGNSDTIAAEQVLTANQQSILDKLANQEEITPEEKALLLEWNILEPSTPRTPGRDGHGGPDEYGYRWEDSDEEGTDLEYNWIEINEIGTAVALRDDETTGRIDIGFPFPFYNDGYRYGDYETFRICSNGYISFTSNRREWDHRNQEFPSGQYPKCAIVPLWIDLDPGREENIYYWTNEDNDMLVVEWDNVPLLDWDFYHPNGCGDGEEIGPKKFQLILHADGTIIFQYHEENCPTDQGVVGIQDRRGEMGLTVASNEEYLHAGLAVRIGFNFGEINGTISSSVDDSPIEGATVTLSNNAVTETDENGEYLFENVWTGDYTISVVAAGFIDLTTDEFSTVDTPEMTVNIGLARADFVGGEEYDTPGTANNIYINGTLLFVADGESGLRIFDISDQENIVELGSVDTDGEALSVYVIGDFAYVCDGPGGLVIINISDPENPSMAASYDSPGIAYYVYVIGDHAYIADGESGLLIINISDLENLQLIGTYNTPGVAIYVTVIEDYVYLADMNGGFFVINISDPQNPALAGTIDTEGTVYNFHIIGNYVFMVDGDGGVLIIDISDPGDMRIAGTYDTPGSVISIYFLAGFAYIIDDENGFYLLDISDPEDIIQIGHYEIEGALWIRVVGDYAFIAVGGGGFVLIDCSNMTGDPITMEITSPSSGATWDVGDIMEFRWSPSARYGIDNFIISYSTNGGGNWTEIVTLEGDVTEYDWEIPELYSQNFRVRIRCNDLRGNRINRAVRNMTISAVEGEIDEPLIGGWNMVSFPLNADDPDVNAVIGDDLIENAIFAVYSFGYWVGFERVQEIECGPGYWMVVAHDTSFFSMEGEANLDTVEIDLTIAWNMIGCPFPTEVSLSDVLYRFEDQLYTEDEAVEAELITPMLYGYRQQRGYFESQKLSPFYGYWFLVPVRGLQMVIPPPDPMNGPDRDAPDAVGNSTSWELPIIATKDGVSDLITTLGSNIMAADSFDAEFDFLEPLPGPEGDVLKSYFVHRDWLPEVGNQFNRDIRGVMDDETQEWELTVEVEEPGEVTLTWPAISFKPLEGYVYILEDPVADQTVNMLDADNYIINIEDSTRNIIIRVTAPLKADNQLLPAPENYELLNAYPNPFNAITSIGYNMSLGSKVAIDVYDMAGSRLANLVDGYQPGGYHQVTWDANNTPGGIYFVRMSAPGFTATQKVVLMK
ncbi:MAG: T9SS type A sorting domain-containing protein [Calditrichaeota bacterium]|nr:T9SS type A sorting domain-containing protein [Calditrichota bacterium]